MDSPQGARVEIIDPSGLATKAPTVLLPTVDRVNGVDVGLLAEGGVAVNAGSHAEPTTVTLVLLPESVEIKLADPEVAG